MASCSGYFELQASAPGTDRVSLISTKIIDAIKEQVKNVSIESTAPIVYKRPLYQNGVTSVSSFSGGTITVNDSGNAIHIRYEFNIAPYIHVAGLMAAATILSLMAGHTLMFTFWLVLIGEVLIFARFVYSRRAIKKWLISIVDAALSKNP